MKPAGTREHEPPASRTDRSGRTDDELLGALPRAEGREVRVGIFVILAIATVIVALFTMTEPAFFRARYLVTTTVPDAGGIRKGDPVQMLGVNIGRVRSFTIGADQVDVELELERRYPVPADSRVRLVSGGLLGGMVAEVAPGRSPERLSAGAVLPGATAPPGLFAAGTEAGESVQNVLSSIEALLSAQTIDAVEGSASELRVLLTELSAITNEQRDELRALTGSLRRGAAGFERLAASPGAERTLVQVEELVQRLDEAGASVDRSTRSLEAVLGRVERGEGTLGRFTQDDALYENLNRMALSLAILFEDIRENPRRYVNVRIF